MNELKMDEPFEVTERQYTAIMYEFSGCVFERKDEEGKYWIKPACCLVEIQRRLGQLK